METASNAGAATLDAAAAVNDTVSAPVVKTINAYVRPKVRSYVLIVVIILIVVLILIDLEYDNSGYLGRQLESIFGRGRLITVHVAILIAISAVYILPDYVAARKGLPLRTITGRGESFFGGSWFGEDTTNKSHPYYTTGSSEKYTVSDSSL